LADNGYATHKEVTQPTTRLAQNGESSLAEISVLTTMLLCQQLNFSVHSRVAIFSTASEKVG